ncbi:hemerythrin domain-containing protein [Uliginosibacterium gangwonense]|uniref:hemerythrin domain-containing protein n=1 Tax=Uliginosibacterium gangwonense TaxID=392736 RepID=UPI0003673E93|nr:hemerythrin domain-containing protein [Uliginosibacterium gangwonense]
MSKLVWQNSRHALQAGAMDGAHREFVVLINQLAEASDQEELHHLNRLQAHCEDHFAQEARWMQLFSLPNPEKHLRDHDEVMALLRQAHEDLRGGKAGSGRELTETLARWFERHSTTLDAALAFQMQQTSQPKCVGIAAVG